MRKLVTIAAVLIAGAFPACVPCRQVRIDSRPSGAEVYILEEGDHRTGMRLTNGEAWRKIGFTPLTVNSCQITSELKSRWEEEEIFLFDYRGQEYLRFDFEKGEVSSDPGFNFGD